MGWEIEGSEDSILAEKNRLNGSANMCMREICVARAHAWGMPSEKKM